MNAILPTAPMPVLGTQLATTINYIHTMDSNKKGGDAGLFRAKVAWSHFYENVSVPAKLDIGESPSRMARLAGFAIVPFI